MTQPTNADVHLALLGSIKKWIDIAYSNGEDIGVDNCPLCKVFYANGSCQGCPIQVDTKRNGCNNTPYDEWCDAVLVYETKLSDLKDTRARRLAQVEAIRMLKYLQKLERKFFK